MANYDLDPVNKKSDSIFDEIWADTILSLGPHTLLWTILSRKDLTADTVKITTDDFYRIKQAFVNCGYPRVCTTFERFELINWLKDMAPYIVPDQEVKDGWIVNLNKLANTNDLSDKEITYLSYNEVLARNFLIFCNLQIDYYKMMTEPKLVSIYPGWSNLKAQDIKSHDEIKGLIRKWKHIPDRYRN